MRFNFVSRFPILTNKDIIECLIQMKIDFVKCDIVNLSLDSFKLILYSFVEFFSGKNYEKIGRLKLKTLEFFNYPELHEKSIIFINKFRIIQEIIFASCIYDFSLQDFYYFDSLRLKKIISGVINFAKFKEKLLLFIKKINITYVKIDNFHFKLIIDFYFLKKKILFLQFIFPSKNLKNKKIQKKFYQFEFFFYFFYIFFLNYNIKLSNKNYNFLEYKILEKKSLFNQKKIFFINFLSKYISFHQIKNLNFGIITKILSLYLLNKILFFLKIIKKIYFSFLIKYFFFCITKRKRGNLEIFTFFFSHSQYLLRKLKIFTLTKKKKKKNKNGIYEYRFNWAIQKEKLNKK